MRTRFSHVPQLAYDVGVTFGCDPELFLEKDGKVIGAEKVIPADGLPGQDWGGTPTTYHNTGKMVLDGVQIELNPSPDQCRANIANKICAMFKTLKSHLATMDGISASFTAVVDVDKTELASLSDKARELGCMPSNNVYDPGATVKVKKGFRQRSAGGHIHLGYPLLQVRDGREEVMVKVMDVLVGNTCVLLDRDPLAAERRKLYGRAGEHRLPTYGIEYRTLSNFWLKSYPLFSLVLALSRHATTIVSQSYQADFRNQKFDYATALLQHVDLEKVVRAINTNDADLAWENFSIVEEWFTHQTQLCNGLSRHRVPKFKAFALAVQENGLDHFWPGSPIDHWTTIGECHSGGWETFIDNLSLPMPQPVVADPTIVVIP